MSKDDCISRRDAIDAMKDMYRAAEKWLRDATDDVTKARAESCMASLVEIKLRIEKLPAVQPELDCALKEFGDCSYSETGCSDCKIKNRIRTALNVAQPEIIRCKNCKYWVVEEDEAYCYRIVMVHGAKDGSGFCSEAKRKMDNE